MIGRLLLCISVVLSCVACEKALPGYNTSWSGVQFVLNTNSLSANSFAYSFVGKDENLKADTVWFTVRPQGMIPDRTCRIRLEQYEGKELQYVYGDNGAVVDSIFRVFPRQAKSGVHYVPFDNETMESYLTLEAGEMEARIPVVVLRDESLKDTTYTLFFHIVDSEDLRAGDPDFCEIQLRIADCLTRPGKWDDWFFAGAWSEVRHEFMIKVTGELFDDDFISSLTVDDKNYYLYVFNRELRRENEERATQGLPPLREDPEDPTTELIFPTVAYW